MDHRLIVLGAGVMGVGISTLALRHGVAVTLVDRTDEILADARTRVAGGLRMAQLVAGPPDGAPGELQTATSARPALAAGGVTVVIEAVVEDAAVKAGVLAEVSAAAPGIPIITNTSSIPVGELADAVARPEDLLGTHFMNPSYLIATVEVIRGPRTGAAAMETVADLLAVLRRKPIVVQDAPGFVTSRLLHPMINDAARVVQEGTASVEDVDALMQGCLGHPTGPLRTADVSCWQMCGQLAGVGEDGRLSVDGVEQLLQDAGLCPVHPGRCLRIGRVRGGMTVPATVARPLVHPVALQAAPAQPAHEQPGQLVAVDAVVAGGGDLLDGEEVGVADQRRMSEFGRGDPVRAGVPHPHRALTGAPVAGHGLTVIGELPVPYLPAGVAGVGQDRGHRPQCPHRVVAVGVAVLVVHAGRGDTALVEQSGDPRRAHPVQPAGEHPPHRARGCRVDVQAVLAASPCRMHHLRVRAGVDQAMRRLAMMGAPGSVAISRQRRPSPTRL